VTLLVSKCDEMGMRWRHGVGGQAITSEMQRWVVDGVWGIAVDMMLSMIDEMEDKLMFYEALPFMS
jgi:hypothetical protein